ncbi:transcription factor Atoh8-like [Mya arenaria]|uniref:transcription factor Atoh8-like n=1 Tax=Mya arenaria TaxID=6604 RepID=UPI0022E75964|nr:transcription factor Atoh8-like [Mya arenaria]
MALELTVRHGTVHSPVLVVPTPDFKRYQRQTSLDSELSPSDTPRKNKRKLSEPKRRTTDFSIKRLCPDSPGSACSESGRSEGSTPERSPDDTRESCDNVSPPDMAVERDRLYPHHPHLRPPVMYPDMRHNPYFIPPFYYGRIPPGFPAPVGHLPGFPGMGVGIPGMATVPSLSAPSQAPGHHHHHHSRASSQEDAGRSGSPPSPSPPPRSRAQQQVHKHKKSHVSTPCSSQTPQPSACPPSPAQEEGDTSSMASPDSPKDGKKCNRKNYKNMTRERRVEANARERSRVHTISAAFDGLRHAVPSYSYNQKLSKLAILRIACSYINALSKLTDSDVGSPEIKDVSFADCVDNCTRTIQTEGKARRRH